MIGQFFGEEILKSLIKTGATTLQLTAGSRFRIGGLGARLDSALNLDFSGNGLGGLDTGSIAASTLYYIYAVTSGTTVGLVASLNANGPTGFLIFKEIGKVTSNSISEITNPVRLNDMFEQFVRAETVVGRGSTNTKIPYFSSIDKNNGSELATIVNPSDFGFSATILYKCECSGMYVAGANLNGQNVGNGFSLNSGNLSTDLGSLTISETLGISQGGQSTSAITGLFTAHFDEDFLINDIIRPHDGPNSFQAVVSLLSLVFKAKYDDVI